MNILLVDDEPIFIDKLRRIIEDYNREHTAGAHIIGEAYSGQEALRFISDTPPDLIFTDIKMSNMNGIELSKCLQQDHPDIAIVFISGYPSFDYAREAIRANVADYLLKPIEPKLVKELLHRMLPQIAHHKYRQSKEVIQSLIESNLPLNSNSVPDASAKMISSNHITEAKTKTICEYAAYYVLAVQKLEAVNHKDRLFIQQSENMHETYIHNLQKIVGSLSSIWIFNSQDRRSLIIVVGLHEADEQQLHFIAQATQTYFSFGGVPVSVTYSQQLDSLANLREEIHQLLNVLYNRLVIGSAQMISSQEGTKQPQKIFTQLTNQMETKILSLISKKNEAALSKEFHQLFKIWQSEQCPSIYIEKSMKRLIRLMERHLQASDAIVSKALENRIEEILYTAASFEEAAQFCWDMITELLQLQSGKPSPTNTKALFESIQHYLQSHLNEPIGLTQLNEIFKVSNTYLCNLFRNYADASFVEYFTALRMEKAKELIRDHPDMMLKDIAELVGYRDHHYFSRVFKMITGQTPSDFKNN
ncbi:response regulator [Paenibacillus eucommiae]|uniref:YesN/AraC family two-component response regulator n=1 Tax=Paenibacillus eucommiae TaxID=1355755 RepID=A0ABS4IXA0_9BACL|nr:response regulator [Paenibacillus eucommiae]MBP1992194.1 YesN/AraC family two-component response regulator [Paenibacillus eucommiae]